MRPVTFQDIDIVVVDSPLMQDGNVSGNQNAFAVKDILKMDTNEPLMEELGK